jgi:hypothetical protein
MLSFVIEFGQWVLILLLWVAVAGMAMHLDERDEEKRTK